MAKREGAEADGSNGKKQGFSSRLLQMKFMQRKQEKRKAEEVLDQVAEPKTEDTHWVAETSQSGCILICEPDPPPGALMGHMDFGGFNLATEKVQDDAKKRLEAAKTGGSDVPVVSDLEMAKNLSIKDERVSSMRMQKKKAKKSWLRGMASLGSIVGDRWGITGQSTLVASASALAALLVVAEKEAIFKHDFLNSQLAKLSDLPTYKLCALGAAAALLFIYAAIAFFRPAVNRVLLLDFSCFTIPQRLKCSRKRLMDEIRAKGIFTEQNVEFQEKILERAGLGDETGLSDGIAAMKDGEVKTTLRAALDESEMVLYEVVENLLAKTNTDPQEIDIVIVSCSCFAPTPSMAAMITNHFKLRRDVLTYNLSGMGCSSSLICVDLVKHLLKAMPNKLALIVNHENITQNWYVGNDRSMLVCNCLFRLGGAGALLSNRPKDIRRAKYELLHTVRVHLGCEDDAFGCMGNGEDSEGIKGVFLRRNVVSVAGRALKVNLQRLGPLVLPISEMVKAVMNKAYVPKFNNAFEHFLLHTGGRAVIDEMEEKLSLTPAQCQPSKDALYRFGNTSAASTWYILSNIEHFSGVRRGDRIWQLGFGGGFKCNSAVWRARRSFKDAHDCWE